MRIVLDPPNEGNILTAGWRGCLTLAGKGVVSNALSFMSKNDQFNTAARTITYDAA